MLPNDFDYIFVHLRQKARLRPELSPFEFCFVNFFVRNFVNFRPETGPNPAQTRPEKPGPTYNPMLY